MFEVRDLAESVAMNHLLTVNLILTIGNTPEGKDQFNGNIKQKSGSPTGEVEKPMVQAYWRRHPTCHF
jgi:hypothetical protein